MNRCHIPKKFLKQLGKLVFVILGTLSLFTTAFTAPALAEVKEITEQHKPSSLQEIAQTNYESVEGLARNVIKDVATDIVQLFDASEDTNADASTAETTFPSDEVQAPEDEFPVGDESFSIAAAVPAQIAAAVDSPANEAIVVDGDTVTIQGDCTTTDIFNVMRKDGGAGVNATKLHFSNSITITTLQTSDSDSPFSQTKIQSITADENASVSFVGEDPSKAPTLQEMFYLCSDLVSIDGLFSWDVANVTGNNCMFYMFSDCYKLSSLDGIANWDVSQVTGNYCMTKMFYSCHELTSLDDLAMWNVSKVSGDYCMDSMFYECRSLTSLDGIANWNLTNAIDPTVSFMGVPDMFNSCTSLSSFTVSPTDGFQLDSNMSIPSTFSTGGNYWWPVKGADKGITTNALYDASKNTDTYGTRWVRGEETVNPYISGVVPEVTWTTIAKPYTGLNQTIGPDKVEVDGTELKAGADYTVLYTKNTTQENAEVASPTVRDVGSYKANLYLQGKYVAQEDPSYTQTVYVTESGTVMLTFSAAGGTFASTGTDILFLLNNVPGHQLNSIEEPTQDGLYFAGWKDAAGAKVSFPLTIPNADTIYTAIWSTEPAPAPTPEPIPISDGSLLPLTGDRLTQIAMLAGMVAIGVVFLGSSYALKRHKD